MALRLGLAGLGIHGARYARHLLRGDVSGARLVAICRRDARAGRQFADEHGLAFVETVDELATRADVDAVVVVLPPDVQAQSVATCLAHRRPVLVEKPLAGDAATAARLARDAEHTATPLMVAHTLRFDPLIRALAREVPRLEPLRVISLNQRFEPTTRPWLDEPGPGGVMLNTGVHGFDLLRYLTGREPVAVWAEAGRGVTEHTEDQFVALLRLEPGGLLAVLDNARSTRSRSGRIEIVGDPGQVWGDHVHRTLQRVEGSEVIDLGPVVAQPTIPPTLESFVRSVRQATAPEVSADDGRIAVELVDAARRSARLGRRVTLDEVRADGPSGAG